MTEFIGLGFAVNMNSAIEELYHRKRSTRPSVWTGEDHF